MNTPSAQGFECCNKFGSAGGLPLRLCVWNGGVREFRDLVRRGEGEQEEEEEGGGGGGDGYWEGLFLQV